MLSKVQNYTSGQNYRLQKASQTNCAQRPVTNSIKTDSVSFTSLGSEILQSQKKVYALRNSFLNVFKNIEKKPITEKPQLELHNYQVTIGRNLPGERSDTTYLVTISDGKEITVRHDPSMDSLYADGLLINTHNPLFAELMLTVQEEGKRMFYAISKAGKFLDAQNGMSEVTDVSKQSMLTKSLEGMLSGVKDLDS